MRVRDLLNVINALDDEIQEGDHFLLDLEDLLIETTVVGVRADGIVIILDETALAYVSTAALEEATYQGRKVSLGKPVLTPNGPKKRSVYVKDPSTGNIKKVNFGDKTMRIKKSSPAHRKSYRARHHCASPGPRTGANYWSCKQW